MLTAIYINDLHYMHGEKIPFSYVKIGHLCRHFNVINETPHDALSDARAEAEVYRNMLMTDWLR
jgi:DNA polymerase III epsilon subunit-like protein